MLHAKRFQMGSPKGGRIPHMRPESSTLPAWTVAPGSSCTSTGSNVGSKSCSRQNFTEFHSALENLLCPEQIYSKTINLPALPCSSDLLFLALTNICKDIVKLTLVFKLLHKNICHHHYAGKHVNAVTQKILFTEWFGLEGPFKGPLVPLPTLFPWSKVKQSSQ